MQSTKVAFMKVLKTVNEAREILCEIPTDGFSLIRRLWEMRFLYYFFLSSLYINLHLKKKKKGREKACL